MTTWRRLPVTGDWERSYAGEEPGMQVRAWLGRGYRLPPQTVTNWRRLPVVCAWGRSYAGEEPGMQARM